MPYVEHKLRLLEWNTIIESGTIYIKDSKISKKKKMAKNLNRYFTNGQVTHEKKNV